MDRVCGGRSEQHTSGTILYNIAQSWVVLQIGNNLSLLGGGGVIERERAEENENEKGGKGPVRNKKSIRRRRRQITKEICDRCLEKIYSAIEGKRNKNIGKEMYTCCEK